MAPAPFRRVLPATSLAPSPPGKVATFLWSQGTSALQDSISDQPSSLAEEWAKDSDGGVKQALRIQSYNQMLDHGLIDAGDPGALPEECLTEDGKSIKPTLYDGDPSNNSSAEQAAFTAWLSRSANQGPSQQAINSFVANLPQGAR